ncbi:MAG TPA: hypothetical protein VHP11_06520, partial [Tepidisphaeraceae bacterium]|nr:hypothetical protein [Tepidisphaeraceae bacterium]
YLIEYPEPQVREKIKVLTDHLEQTFQTAITSHRAGRWGLNEVYAKALIDFGYRVDCSVTPHISWRQYAGHPEGRGGSDFTDYPETAYFVDPSNVGRAGQSSLLEIPISIISPYHGRVARVWQAILQITGVFGNRIARHFFPAHARLIPNGSNRKELFAVLLAALHHQRDYVQLTLHSSELMPGGSPAFSSTRSIEQLYDDLNAIFTFARERFVGLTLTAYRNRFSATAASSLSSSLESLQ